jgi:hypothetical protein
VAGDFLGIDSIRALAATLLQSSFAVLMLSWCGVTASGAAEPDRSYAVTEEREPCADFQPLRNAYFGDIHSHTSFSQDASVKGTRNEPRDAYRFARGERIGIQPYDEQGVPWATVQLERPLDFAAVTDHAEMLGEVHICLTPGLPGHDSRTCRMYRGWPTFAYFLMNARVSRANPIRFAFCGTLGIYCLEAAQTPWAEIQRAAEAAYDRSPACRFTSFVGYEWTGSRSSNNLHRNVIFRNERTLDLPISFYEESRAEGLWEQLRAQCLDRGDGCEALVIPHNSNLSSGLMFETEGRLGQGFTAATAASRARIERLVEIMQHKGDSECSLGVDSSDELCGFEKLSFGSLGGKYIPFMGDPKAPASFVRNALKLGIEQHAKIGANPFKLGIIAGTDSHVGTPGNVVEDRHVNHAGRGKPVLAEPPAGLQDSIEFNPGGLAGVWAEENARDSLFAALQRREVFGTSGPRIPVRFFASWNSPGDVCSNGTLVERGYADGVPMGGDLPPRPSDAAAPSFSVWAMRDPGSQRRPGTQLQRLQIVKGWVENGVAREVVHDVAGSSAGNAMVDVYTCEQHGEGFDDLCTVWVDPDFDPQQHAFYYARVIENPSCRWSAHACNRLGVDCFDRRSAKRELFGQCCSKDRPRDIQERAWSSPIWYEPAPATP